MEKTRFVALVVTSAISIVLATVGYILVTRPAETACYQLLQMLGADTTAFRNLGRLIAWCSAWAVLSMLIIVATSGYLCQHHKLPTEYRKRWHIRLATCALLGSVCLETACAGTGLASCSVVLGMSRTLLVTVQRMSMASSSAQGALVEAQQQFQRQLQQPPEGLQQVLRDTKASLPVLPEPPEPIKHALHALADATLSRLVQPAVDGVQHAVQQQVTSAISSSATELTRNNTALAGMVAQLEALAGNAALRQEPKGGGRACAPPCLDLKQYPVLHSQACICAAEAFARMRALAEHVAALSTWAVMGWGLQAVCCMLSLAIFSHWLGRTSYWNTMDAKTVATYQQVDTACAETGAGISWSSGGQVCSTGVAKSAELELNSSSSIDITCTTNT